MKNGSLSEILRLVSILVAMPPGTIESDRGLASELSSAAAALQRGVARADRRALGRPSPDGRRYALAPREREIVRLLLAGRSYKEIASEIGIAFSSTQSRVKGIYMKVGVHSKAQLRGVLSPDAGPPAGDGPARATTGRR